MKITHIFALAFGLAACTPNNNPDLQKEFDHKFNESLKLKLDVFIPELEPNDYDQYDSLKLPPEIEPHIPNGYYILDTIYGDINKDGLMDIILVTEKSVEEFGERAPRPLFIFTGKTDNTYELAVENHSAIMPFGCVDMIRENYVRITTSPYGFFTIVHYGVISAHKKWLRQDYFYWSEITNTWQLLVTKVEHYQLDTLRHSREIESGASYDFLRFSEFSQGNCP